MIDFQSHLIFPVHAVPRAGPLPKGAQRLVVSARDAELHGVHIPADDPGPETLLILGFGGNGWNGQDVAEYLHAVFPDDEVVAFHYRGYPPSTGTPSGDALVADAPLIYDAAAKRVKCDRAFAVGFSIGTAIAAQLSAERELDGLILVTPFDSLKAVAQAMYPWLPIGPFFNHEIDAATPLKSGHVPVAVLAADHDELVPTNRTDALRSVVSNLVFDRTLRNAGHNSIYARSDFQEAMRSARSAVLEASKGKGTG